MKRWKTIVVILGAATILLASGYYMGFAYCWAIVRPALFEAETTINNQMDIIDSQSLYIEALELYRDMLGIDNRAFREENDSLRQVVRGLKVENIGIEIARAKMETMLNDFEAVKIPMEVIKEVPISLREWESLEQFEEWYWEQRFPEAIGIGNINFQTGEGFGDCDDHSVLVQETALAQGYAVSEALVIFRKYYNVRVMEENVGHAGCLVLIDGTYYYFDPRPSEFKMIKIVGRD